MPLHKEREIQGQKFPIVSKCKFILEMLLCRQCLQRRHCRNDTTVYIYIWEILCIAFQFTYFILYFIGAENYPVKSYYGCQFCKKMRLMFLFRRFRCIGQRKYFKQLLSTTEAEMIGTKVEVSCLKRNTMIFIDWIEIKWNPPLNNLYKMVSRKLLIYPLYYPQSVFLNSWNCMQWTVHLHLNMA